jgi:uncharacterized protein (TIGR03067 family)
MTAPITRALVLGSVLLLGCKRPANEAGDRDLLNSIQGKYTCVEMEVGGKVLPPEVLQKMGLKYEVRGNQLIAFPPKGGEDPLAFRLDTSKQPVWIDFEETQADKTVRTTTGLVKFENGVLFIVMSDSEKPEDRPKGFKEQQGKVALLVLKKDEPAAKQ